MELSVIIPAYNESIRIKETIDKIKVYLDNNHIEGEIIIVDDGSHDNTLEVLNSLNYDSLIILSNGANRGKGYSIKKGILNAKGDKILFSDADMSTPITETSQFLKEVVNSDVVIGSRRMDGSNIKIKQPGYRVLLGRVFSFLVKILFSSKFKDTQCGFKMFTKSAANNIFKRQRLERFAFDVEILYIASILGYKVSELPVSWYNNSNSKVNPIIDPLRMLRDIIRIRINSLFGRYD